jgi:ArsR family transcriptional regulator, arsenate/arsenite/antimonite-responsive transcriptional repressor
LTIIDIKRRDGAVPTTATKPVSCCAKASPRLSDDDARRYARMMKALSDETRLKILDLVAGAGEELCACEIETFFELSQPTISHHLKILREAGIVDAEKRGPWVYYRLARGAFAGLGEICARLAC